MSKNLVEYFSKTNIDWSISPTPNLIDFYFHTRLYVQNFNFASADGLDNMKSNLHTLLKEVQSELKKRNVDVSY